MLLYEALISTQALADAHDVCVIRDKNIFISKFSELGSEQLHITHFPLLYSTLIPTETDYEEKIIFADNIRDLKFSYAEKGYIFPNKLDRKNSRMKIKSKHLKKNLVVELYQDNTDNLAYCYFRKNGKCWILYKV